jgi:hypothetical protein
MKEYSRSPKTRNSDLIAPLKFSQLHNGAGFWADYALSKARKEELEDELGQESARLSPQKSARVP